MKKFSLIIKDAENPELHTSRYPAAPATATKPRDVKMWKVQCLLMAAEFRYSMYLDLLEKKYAQAVSKQDWPLPPW